MNNPFYLKCLFLLAIIFSFFSCVKPTIQSVTLDDKVNTYVDSIVQPFLDSSQIAGTTIGIAQGDRIIFLKSYGYADLEAKTPLPVGATFEIASITKSFTALAVLQLAQKGRLHLDDNIRKYIAFDTKARVVTIRQLLNHTSGITDYTRSAIPGKLKGLEYLKDTVAHMLQQEEFDFEPGTAMGYSNSGYLLLGLIIEKVAGTSYEDYLQKNVFQKVGMRHTCECDSTAGKIPGLVKGYNTDKSGRLSRVKPGNFEMAIAAGSLCSTVSDLLRWNLALHRSKKLLTPESYQAMIRPTTLLDGTEVRYGLGLQLNNYLGNPVIFHRGVIEGFLSDARYFPESDLTIVTLINTLGPIKPVNVSNTIAEFFIQEKDRTKVYEGDLSVFAGAYSGKVMGRKLVRNFEVSGNKLFMVLPDQRYSLEYIGNNQWLSEDDYIYTFSTGQETKVQINDPLMSFTFTKE